MHAECTHAQQTPPNEQELNLVTPVSLRSDTFDMNRLASRVIGSFHGYFLPGIRSRLLLIVDLISGLVSWIVEHVLTYHPDALLGAILGIFGFKSFHHSIIGSHGSAWTVHNLACKPTVVALGQANRGSQ